MHVSAASRYILDSTIVIRMRTPPRRYADWPRRPIYTHTPDTLLFFQSGTWCFKNTCIFTDALLFSLAASLWGRGPLRRCAVVLWGPGVHLARHPPSPPAARIFENIPPHIFSPLCKFQHHTPTNSPPTTNHLSPFQKWFALGISKL